MGKMERRKGANAENEVSKILTKQLGFKIERNLGQARDGGADIMDVPLLAIEVKRQETLKLPEWWRQTVDQAFDCKPVRLPILIYRKRRTEWLVKVNSDFLNPKFIGRLLNIYWMEIGIYDFCKIYKLEWMKKGKAK